MTAEQTSAMPREKERPGILVIGFTSSPVGEIKRSYEV
jgi:hypothetical protein